MARLIANLNERFLKKFEQSQIYVEDKDLAGLIADLGEKFMKNKIYCGFLLKIYVYTG